MELECTLSTTTKRKKSTSSRILNDRKESEKGFRMDKFEWLEVSLDHEDMHRNSGVVSVTSSGRC